MEPASQLYQYSPLQPSRAETRVFDLFPGRIGEPIRGRLRVVSLHKNPKYDALSYVWGTPEPKTAIYLDGGRHLLAGPNLVKALSDLRHKKRTLTLWVDAITIHQGDEAEKSQQVRMMSDIYTHARLVRAWLDSEIDPKSPVFQALSRITSPDDLLDELPVHVKALATLGIKRSIMSYKEGFWMPLVSVFSDEYWSRLWIQQELMVASTVVFHLRRTIVPGKHLFRFETALHRAWYDAIPTVTESERDYLLKYYLALPIGLFITYADGRRNVRSLHQTTDPEDSIKAMMSLALLFQNGRALGCHDPRDYVYGCLALVPEEDSRAITVDYTLTVLEVYGQVFRHQLRQEQNLEFLCYSSRKEPPPDLQLPSWMPVPQKYPLESQLEPTSAPFGLGPSSPSGAAVSKDGTFLSANGFVVDSIVAALDDGPVDLMPVDTFLKQLQQLYRVSKFPEQANGLFSEGRWLGTFDPMLTQDIWKVHLDAPFPSEEAIRKSLQYLEELSNDPVEAKGTINEAFEGHRELGALREILWLSCSFVTLKSGWVAAMEMSNITTLPQPGDQVLVLAGCSRPVVLRPSNTGPPGSFILVGPLKIPTPSWSEQFSDKRDDAGNWYDGALMEVTLV